MDTKQQKIMHEMIETLTEKQNLLEEKLKLTNEINKRLEDYCSALKDITINQSERLDKLENFINKNLYKFQD